MDTWRHPFDENNVDDINKLNFWKSKHTSFYENAIEIWTERDVLKRKTANDNNLNYLEIFSIDFDKCKNAITNKIKELSK